MHCVTHTIVLWDYTHTHAKGSWRGTATNSSEWNQTFLWSGQGYDTFTLIFFLPAIRCITFVLSGVIFFSFFFFHKKGSFQGQRGREWQVIRITVQPYQVTPSITLICQDCNKIGLGRGKVNILISHVSVSTVHKLTREFIEECGRGGRGGRG